MRRRSESEHIVLGCGVCNEKLILLGPEEEWRSRRAIFRCECGEKITLDNRLAEEALAVPK